MAISKIKKIEIIGLHKDKERFLGLLQKLGIVELINVIESQEVSTGLEMVPSETNLLGIEEAISYLTAFKEKRGLLEGMVKLRPLVYQEQLKEVIANFDYASLLKELSGLRNHLKDFLQHKERLLQEIQLLAPWRNLSIPLEQIHSTQHCSILLGVLRSHDYANLLEDFEKENINLSFEIVNQDRTNVYLVILYIKEEFERLEPVLKNRHFNFITLPRYKLTVKDRLLKINSEVLQLDDNIQDVKERIALLSKQQFKLMVVYDYLANIKKRQEADKSLAKQQFTFCLSGWIKDKDIKLLEKEVVSEFKDTAMFISQPKADETIPVALENNPIIRPFEVVTNLYGQPAYHGLDPTGYLAPFFALSFGLCMLDAGYGLILATIVIFFLRKRQISQVGKNFLKFFLFMSVVTILAGLITGSFFGDLISRLPPQFAFLKDIQKRFILFDPVGDSLVFLGLTLILGFIQVWTGVFIKFLKDLRIDRFTASLLDLPTLMVQISLFVLVLVFAKVLPAFMMKYAGGLLILSAVSVIYYQWKSNGEISLKIFWSVFGIYSIIAGNFLADTLSFSRIFALGLTGSLLGRAINTMLFPKIELTGGLAFIGAIFAILILLIGHIINLAICILGAYVHTSRLQYLEFFTKFFESGGRPFRPFKEEAKYIFLTENQQTQLT